MSQENVSTTGLLNPDSDPMVPARMVNEYVYCPRLAYLEWIQGEFAHNAYTMDGALKHQRVDQGKCKMAEAGDEITTIHARSVELEAVQLGVRAKIDVVEGKDGQVSPVDYKRGKRPHVAQGAYQPERVQVCAQGLILRENGYTCNKGYLYFIESKERVPVLLDRELIRQTVQAIEQLRNMARNLIIPEPLEDSPKCVGCSLIGICLPDEVGFLNHKQIRPRPVFSRLEDGMPLYIQSPRAYVRKSGERFMVEQEGQVVAEARLNETSQVVLYGASGLTTPALHECFRREIPVTYMSYGGWFMGHTVGTGHRNVDIRIQQYRAGFDPSTCHRLARGWVTAKIANCRTLMRRNWHHDQEDGPSRETLMEGFKSDLKRAAKAKSMEALLGVEGSSANRYFQSFVHMIKPERLRNNAFNFRHRNRRPPRDPVNAMLSFAYAMLTREWTVALSAVGFDPYMGFYHQPRFGRPALSLDMMEPFRPLVADSAVLTAINNGEIQPSDFIHRAGACNLVGKGRKKFISIFERRMNQEITHPIFGYRISYRRLLEVQARLLARFLAGEIPRYPNFVTR